MFKADVNGKALRSMIDFTEKYINYTFYFTGFSCWNGGIPSVVIVGSELNSKDQLKLNQLIVEFSDLMDAVSNEINPIDPDCPTMVSIYDCDMTWFQSKEFDGFFMKGGNTLKGDQSLLNRYFLGEVKKGVRTT